MKEVFIKKYWDEEGVLFYLHFQDGWAFRQIEISSDGKAIYLSDDDPVGRLEIADQELDQLEYDDNDIITKEEFEEVWKQHKQR